MMKDFLGNVIIRPVCPHCTTEMRWDPDNYYGDKPGYYCLTEDCEMRGRHQSEIEAPDASAVEQTARLTFSVVGRDGTLYTETPKADAIKYSAYVHLILNLNGENK